MQMYTDECLRGVGFPLLLQWGDADSSVYNCTKLLEQTGETDSMVDEELLKILVCPENKTPVSLAEQGVIDRVNGVIAAGSLKNRGGELVDQAIDGGLLREDGTYLYLIREDIPVMLIDEAIPMAEIG